MSKSIKYKNNTYIDSTGVVHNTKLLSSFLEPEVSKLNLVSNCFSTIDTNTVMRIGNIVHVSFRALTAKAIGNMEVWAYTPYLWDGNSKSGWTFPLYQGRYEMKNPLFMFVNTNMLNGNAIPTGTWVQCDFVYICK